MTNEYGFEIPLVSEEECKLQERIEELEKENEELKEINEGYCRNRDRLISMGFPTFKDCKEYAEHLTKAKEIILVIVYRVNSLGANIAITNWYGSFKDTKVIAWKEIVPPKKRWLGRVLW